MKKLFLTIALIALVFLGVSALPSDFRLRAMGNANACDTSENGAIFTNPASLYFHNSETFLNVHVSLSDYHKSDETDGWPFLPGGDFHARFAGKFLSFTGSIMTQSISHNGHYDSIRTFAADVSATAGWKEYASVGIGLNAGLKSEREGFYVSDNNRLMDFVRNMIAGEYSRIDDSEFAVVRAGAQISYGGFRIGLMAPQVYTYQNGNGVFSSSGLSAGVAYNGSQYYGRARLNTFVISALVEINNLIDEEKILHTGAELSINVTPSNKFSVRAGYESSLSNMSEGTLTLGASAVSGRFEINTFVELPVQNLQTISYSIDLVFYY